MPLWSILFFALLAPSVSIASEDRDGAERRGIRTREDALSAQELEKRQSEFRKGLELGGRAGPRAKDDAGKAGVSQRQRAKIDAILQAWRAGKIDKVAARRQLRVPVALEVEGEVEALPVRISGATARLEFLRRLQDDSDGSVAARIAALEKELAFLHGAKADPQVLVDARIDSYLQTSAK